MGDITKRIHRYSLFHNDLQHLQATRIKQINEGRKTGKTENYMQKIGELVHIDCHQLSKGITIAEPPKRSHIVRKRTEKSSDFGRL